MQHKHTHTRNRTKHSPHHTNVTESTRQDETTLQTDAHQAQLQVFHMCLAYVKQTPPNSLYASDTFRHRLATHASPKTYGRKTEVMFISVKLFYDGSARCVPIISVPSSSISETYIYNTYLLCLARVLFVLIYCIHIRHTGRFSNEIPTFMLATLSIRMNSTCMS